MTRTNILDRFLKTVCITLVSVFLMQAPLAGTGDDLQGKPITVVIAPQVQRQLEKLRPQERLRVEVALKVGNQFAAYYFDGSVLRLTDGKSVEEWERKIGPLVNKKVADWEAVREQNESGILFEIQNKPAGGVVVCRRVHLTLFEVGATGIRLTYKARAVGTILSDPEDFFKPKGPLQLAANDSFLGVDVQLDLAGRVDSIRPEFQVAPFLSDAYIYSYRNNIEVESARQHSMPKKDRKQSDKKVEQYRRWIQLIKKQEIAVCGKGNEVVSAN